jgi:catechol 2,3-dioxygenase-like lactoylglutathione lyase family enzyme
MPDSGLQPPSVLESAVYCPDLEGAERFYHEVLGLEVLTRQTGRHVFLRCGPAMVLLFNPDATADAASASGGLPVPSHGARGPGHLAFRLPERDIERWRSHLSGRQVPIEAEVTWPQGGYSIYLRDPAGNSIELATAAVWGLPETDGEGLW